MELNTRLLKEEDWETLCKWWESWPKWVNPPKSFLPDNGTGGLMVEKDRAYALKTKLSINITKEN